MRGRARRPASRQEAAFLTEQGVPAGYGEGRATLDIHAVDALRAYLARHPGATAPLRGAIVLVWPVPRRVGSTRGPRR